MYEGSLWSTPSPPLVFPSLLQPGLVSNSLRTTVISVSLPHPPPGDYRYIPIHLRLGGAGYGTGISRMLGKPSCLLSYIPSPYSFLMTALLTRARWNLSVVLALVSHVSVAMWNYMSHSFQPIDPCLPCAALTVFLWL